MNKRVSMVAAAAALASMPLLAACGSGTDGQGGSSTSSSSQPAGSGSTSSAPSSAAATPTPAPSSSSAKPTSDPSEEKGEVRDATEKFVKTALTIGYPDKSFDDYIKGLKPLMTKHGYAEANKSTKSKATLEKGFKTLAGRHGRTAPKINSAVKVTSITAEKARSSVTYQLRTQVQTGGKWKTLQTSAKDTATVQLVKDGGKWLVDGF